MTFIVLLLQLLSWVCGQYREDTDTQVIQSLADQLAARNEYCIRGFYLPAPAMQTPTSIDRCVHIANLGFVTDVTYNRSTPV